MAFSSGILAAGTVTDILLQSSTSLNGGGYPSEMITGTQPAKTDSTTLGLATSKPLGQRARGGSGP